MRHESYELHNGDNADIRFNFDAGLKVKYLILPCIFYNAY